MERQREREMERHRRSKDKRSDTERWADLTGVKCQRV